MIRVEFCCNDERGNFAGRFSCVRFEDHRGFDATLDGPVTRISVLDGERVRVGRRIFDLSGQRCWVGNMLWDRFDARSKPEALRLLACLLDRGFQAIDRTTEGPFAKVITAHEQRTEAA